MTMWKKFSLNLHGGLSDLPDYVFQEGSETSFPVVIPISDGYVQVIIHLLVFSISKSPTVFIAFMATRVISLM